MIFAFTAGLLSTVNPCGFAMLPAYLSFFMGLEDEDAPRRVVVGRALKIGLIMSAGFVAVFTVIGGAIQLGGEDEAEMALGYLGFDNRERGAALLPRRRWW